MNDNNPVVVTAIDDAFFEPACVMLKSLSINTKAAKITVFIIANQLSFRYQKTILNQYEHSNLEINFIKTDDNTGNDFKTSDRISKTSYYRLYIPQLLKDTYKKIIYLDADIVVEGDIADLWHSSVCNKALMAVPDMNKYCLYVSSPIGLKLYKELKIPAQSRYFNAGVLVMNLEYWRKHNITEKIVQYLKINDEYVLWHDQDGMNAVLWNEWEPLPYKWNLMTCFFEYDSHKNTVFDLETFTELCNSPLIIHYTESNKPWLPDCNHPLKERYTYYLSKIS